MNQQEDYGNKEGSTKDMIFGREKGSREQKVTIRRATDLPYFGSGSDNMR